MTPEPSKTQMEPVIVEESDFELELAIRKIEDDHAKETLLHCNEEMPARGSCEIPTHREAKGVMQELQLMDPLFRGVEENSKYEYEEAIFKVFFFF